MVCMPIDFFYCVGAPRLTRHCQITQSEIPGTFHRKEFWFGQVVGSFFRAQHGGRIFFFAFLAELGHLEQKNLFSFFVFWGFYLKTQTFF